MTSNMNPVMRAMTEIAYYVWPRYGRYIKPSELRKIIKTRYGLIAGEGRGLFTQIRYAYKYAIKEGNKGIADCVASCFIKENGEYAYIP